MALRAGFLGGGNITDTHARAAVACRGLEIAAFHGQDREKTERLAARYGGRAYPRLDDFLAHRPMDLVVIGSPSGCHAEQGIAAARRSLHVLVEKPIDALGRVLLVSARVKWHLHAIEAGDTTLALLEFESGVVGTLEATTCAWPGYPRRVEITGTEGDLAIVEAIYAAARSGRAEPVQTRGPR